MRPNPSQTKTKEQTNLRVFCEYPLQFFSKCFGSCTLQLDGTNMLKPIHTPLFSSNSSVVATALEKFKGDDKKS